MINASVCIISYNSEKTIEECLSKVKDFKEIIVVDSGSTDDTLGICEKYNCIVEYRKFDNFASQKQYALSLCSCKWVLSIDDDEILTNYTINSIKQAIVCDKNIALVFYFREFFMGKYMRHLSCEKPRFFIKEFSSYDQRHKVHERIVLRNCDLIKNKKNIVLHKSTSSVQEYIDKINRYSSAKESNKSTLSLIIKSLFVFHVVFFKNLIIRRLILDGLRGICMSYCVSFYAFLKCIKSIEKKWLQRIKH